MGPFGNTSKTHYIFLKLDETEIMQKKGGAFFKFSTDRSLGGVFRYR